MTTLNKSRGFTIVELLIVIVIIAILAAITIVAYNGITNRANSSSAASAANSLQKKIETYVQETGENGGGAGSYPASGAASLTGASSDKTVALTGVTVNNTAIAAKPSTPQTIGWVACTATGFSAPTGGTITYWKYDGTPGVQTINVGSC